MNDTARTADEFEYMSAQQISDKLHSVKHHTLEVPVKRPWKTIALVIFLFVCGIFFFKVGMNKWEESKSLLEICPIFLLSILLLIPSVYHLVLIFLIVIGYRDYTYDMLNTIQ